MLLMGNFRGEVYDDDDKAVNTPWYLDFARFKRNMPIVHWEGSITRDFGDVLCRDISICLVREALRKGEPVNEGVIYSAMKTLEYGEDITIFLSYLKMAKKRRVSRNLLVGKSEDYRDLMARVRAARYVESVMNIKGNSDVDPIPKENKIIWANALAEMTNPEHENYNLY